MPLCVFVYMYERAEVGLGNIYNNPNEMRVN